MDRPPWLPLLVAGALAVGTTAARADELAPVEQELAQLRYEDARRALDALVARGHHPRDEFLRLCALRGQVASILDGPEPGEREYRRLLVLDPAYHPTARPSPVWQQPFDAAARWVARNGRLTVDVKVGEIAPDRPIDLAVRAPTDPLALVAGARVHYRVGAAGPWLATASATLSTQLPPAPRGATLDYWVEVVDSSDDVLDTVGSADEPRHLVVGGDVGGGDHAVAAEPTIERGRPLRAAGIATGVFAAIGLGAGIGFDAAAFGEFGSLHSSCAPGCTDARLGTLHGEEGAAVAGYALAGVAAVVTIVLLVVDHRSAR